MEDIYNEFITTIDKNRVYLMEPMNKHTTFKIGGPADIFIKINTLDELIYVINKSKEKNINLTILGNGSNILVKDRRNQRNSCKIRIKRNRISRK